MTAAVQPDNAEQLSDSDICPTYSTRFYLLSETPVYNELLVGPLSPQPIYFVTPTRSRNGRETRNEAAPASLIKEKIQGSSTIPKYGPRFVAKKRQRVDLNEECCSGFFSMFSKFRHFPDFFSGKAEKIHLLKMTSSSFSSLSRDVGARLQRIGQPHRASCATTRERTRLTMVIPKVLRKSWPNAQGTTAF